MAKDRTNCFGCERLRIHSDRLIRALGCCGKKGFVVPQHMDNAKEEITFWRVPLNCPLESGVEKREEAPGKKHWVIKTFDELKATHGAA